MISELLFLITIALLGMICISIPLHFSDHGMIIALTVAMICFVASHGEFGSIVGYDGEEDDEDPHAPA